MNFKKSLSQAPLKQSFASAKHPRAFAVLASLTLSMMSACQWTARPPAIGIPRGPTLSALNQSPTEFYGNESNGTRRSIVLQHFRFLAAIRGEQPVPNHRGYLGPSAEQTYEALHPKIHFIARTNDSGNPSVDQACEHQRHEELSDALIPFPIAPAQREIIFERHHKIRIHFLCPNGTHAVHPFFDLTMNSRFRLAYGTITLQNRASIAWGPNEYRNEQISPLTRIPLTALLWHSRVLPVQLEERTLGLGRNGFLDTLQQVQSHWDHADLHATAAGSQEPWTLSEARSATIQIRENTEMDRDGYRPAEPSATAFHGRLGFRAQIRLTKDHWSIRSLEWQFADASTSLSSSRSSNSARRNGRIHPEFPREHQRWSY